MVNNDYYIELTNRNDANYIIEEMLTRENLTDDEEYKLRLLIDMINNTISTDNVSQNLLTVYSNKNLYTPNGSIVEFAEYKVNTLSSDDITKCHNDVKKRFSTLTDNDCVFPANNAYNCHSYAWYEQEPARNNYWIDYPISYIDDFSYTEVTDVRPGDIICYWAYGWNYMSGEKTLGYNITHSAIVVSGSIDLSDNTTLSNINLISKWGYGGVYTHDGDECPYGTEDSEFRYVKAYRPRTNNTYTLASYTSTVNNSLIVNSNTQKIDSYEMYELDVDYTKFYEFSINSNNDNSLDVRLYDEHMQFMDILELDNDTNKVHFIEQLYASKTYYLRVAYANEENIGTINTQIVSRTTAYIGVGDNDVLLNTYNNISEYVYTNNQGPGVYRFKLNGTTIDETSITYPSNSLVLYTNSTRSIEANKLYFDEDEILVYLPSNGAYYLNINLNEANYSSLFISVDSIEKNNIDYINGLTSVSFNILFENKNSLYHYEEVTIKQKSEVQLDIITNGTITDSIPVYVYSRIYDDVTKKYNLVETFIGEITPIDRAPVYTLVLEAGTYYFGYKNNEDNVNINFALRRMVDYNMNMEGILVADPDSTGYDLGTEVLINEGECDEYTITEGFTRNIYLMVEDRLRDPMSRLDYDWYSSNESVATVTNYGTVLAMPVTENTSVTIYAVLKADPKIVYYRTFTVLNDEEENLEEIILNMSYSYVAENGTYQLELTNINCPYPMIQYYSWNIINNSEETVTMNYWGQISSTGTCTVLIEGTYNLNTRVRLYITLTIE